MAIAVVCKETIKAGEKENFIAYMRKMIDLTHKEDGCIAYDLYETAEPDGSDNLVMVEIWESKEALDRHMGSDHFGELIPGGEIYKAAPTEIRIFNRV